MGLLFENRKNLKRFENPERIKVYIGRIVSGEVTTDFRVTDINGNRLSNRVWVYTLDLKETFIVYNQSVTPTAQMASGS